MIRPVIHGPAVRSQLFLVGQAPGPHEAKFMKPFGWLAGRTLFGWLKQAFEADEEEVRRKVYLAAVARCFPGKAKGGGDRRPDPVEIENCRPWLEREVKILKPKLIIPIGTLAIEQVLGVKAPLVETVGRVQRHTWLGHTADVLCLPHPSGASTWHRAEPGKSLLQQALKTLSKHPAVIATFS